MGFVLDKQGNYLPVLGEAAGGGGGGTSDHSQLSNLDYEHAGHTGFMSSANYIPHNTTINVKLDGTGDFDNITDAINFLEGKWSDGTVFIQLGDGTFNISSTLTISGRKCSIRAVYIKGNGINNTTIAYIGTNQDDRIFHANNYQLLYIEDMTLTSTYGTKQSRGVTASVSGNPYLTRVAFDNFSAAISIFAQGLVTVSGGCSFSNCTNAVKADPGTCSVDIFSQISFTNVGTAWSVGNGGVIRGGSANCTYTSVTTKVSQTVGTATNNGWITGLTV